MGDEIERLRAELEEERRRAREVERRYRGLVDQLDAIFWEADAAAGSASGSPWSRG